MMTRASAIFSLLLLPLASGALEPPMPGDEAAGNSKSLGFSMVDSALETDNHIVSPDLVDSLKSRLSFQKSAVVMPIAHPRGFPAQGKPKMLVLLIEFDEYPHKTADTAEAMRAKIFDTGGTPPYDSLTAYYKRSSFGKLEIGGDVLGWYNAGSRADVPQTWDGREALIKKALKNYPRHDFSQYDNNNDGVVDYFAVIWTGPKGEWASFWWGMKTAIRRNALSVGGKRFGTYSWMGASEQWANPASLFGLKTLIHETGHALGLPDYYDYQPGVGPDGGLGYFDMMDANRFDHNCFSKFLLGWVEPEVITATGSVRLRPAAESAQCVLLAPPGWTSNPFSEFFLVENRRKVGNDSDNAFPGGGLVIWHVDARLNREGTNFLYNNQTTGHKLLKLLESDGREEIETRPRYGFQQHDFYSEGRSFGPETVPSSRLYGGTPTGIMLTPLRGDYDASFTLNR